MSSTKKVVRPSIKGEFDFVPVKADTYVMYAQQMKNKEASSLNKTKKVDLKKSNDEPIVSVAIEESSSDDDDSSSSSDDDNE